MEKQLTEKQEEEWKDLCYWWEHEVSDKDMTKFLNGYVWKGTDYERYKKLKAMYQKYLKLKQEVRNSSQA